MSRTADEEFDRLMGLLDLGLQELRKGDGDSTLLVMKEAPVTAQRLRKKTDAICLPNLSSQPPK